jgi:hypothetical protein
MALSVEQARRLAEDASDFLQEEVEVREDYSGRGMYGREVVAFVSEASAASVGVALGFAAGVAFERAEARGDDADFDFDDLPTRVDSMGRGTVIY